MERLPEAQARAVRLAWALLEVRVALPGQAVRLARVRLGLAVRVAVVPEPAGQVARAAVPEAAADLLLPRFTGWLSG